MDQVDDVTRTYLAVEALVLLGGAGTALIAGRSLVARELAPLERVAAVAGDVAARPLHSGEVHLADRVPAADLHGTHEVAQVGTALNALLGNVEESLAARHDSEMQVRRFVADASHELRTPLAAVRGYAELVRRGDEALPPGADHALVRIDSEARRMTTLVEDLLLLARLDAGRPLESAPVDLALVAADAVGDAHAISDDHRWVLDLPSLDDEEDDGEEDGGADLDDRDDAGETGEPTVVRGDEDRLRQVLTNLLANARVHTPPGTTVRVGVRPTPDVVVVTVEDDGPGIDPEILPTLFDRFVRSDTSRARASGAESTGLGLSIVKAVAESHGGTVRVWSGAGGGTSFAVSLPRG